MTVGPEAPATCAWHPDVATGVTCSRCGTPICTACMRSASVGFHCPACAPAPQPLPAAPQRPGVFGRLAGAPVTTTLIVLCTGLYGMELLNSQFENNFAMWNAGVLTGQWYRLITGTFLHDPSFVLHLVLNMWCLWVVGPELERFFGAGRYLLLYLASALGGSMLMLLTGPAELSAVGASGAIFGLFGALYVVARSIRANTNSIVILIVLNLGLTFAAPNYIDWRGHVGGLITGTLVALAYTRTPLSRRRLVDIAVPLVVAAVCVAGVVWRRHTFGL